MRSQVPLGYVNILLGRCEPYWHLAPARVAAAAKHPLISPSVIVLCPSFSSRTLWNFVPFAAVNALCGNGNRRLCVTSGQWTPGMRSAQRACAAYSGQEILSLVLVRANLEAWWR